MSGGEPWTPTRARVLSTLVALAATLGCDSGRVSSSGVVHSYLLPKHPGGFASLEFVQQARGQTCDTFFERRTGKRQGDTSVEFPNNNAVILESRHPGECEGLRDNDEDGRLSIANMDSSSKIDLWNEIVFAVKLYDAMSLTCSVEQEEPGEVVFEFARSRRCALLDSEVAQLLSEEYGPAHEGSEWLFGGQLAEANSEILDREYARLARTQDPAERFEQVCWILALAREMGLEATLYGSFGVERY